MTRSLAPDGEDCSGDDHADEPKAGVDEEEDQGTPFIEALRE
jgi:hypothetical protein